MLEQVASKYVHIMMSAQKQSPKLHLAPEHISHDRSLKAPESIQYDGTTNTLQRDHDVDAPEIDQTASTLQASADRNCFARLLGDKMLIVLLNKFKFAKD